MIDVWTKMQAESREQGFVLGRERGREQMLFSLVGEGLLPLGAAAARANLSEDEFRARMERDKQDRKNSQ